jgi:hypothetical protein
MKAWSMRQDAILELRRRWNPTFRPLRLRRWVSVSHARRSCQRLREHKSFRPTTLAETALRLLGGDADEEDDDDESTPAEDVLKKTCSRPLHPNASEGRGQVYHRP